MFNLPNVFSSSVVGSWTLLNVSVRSRIRYTAAELYPVATVWSRSEPIPEPSPIILFAKVLASLVTLTDVIFCG